MKDKNTQLELKGGAILITPLSQNLLRELMLKVAYDELDVCSALIEIDAVINGCGANEFTRIVERNYSFQLEPSKLNQEFIVPYEIEHRKREVIKHTIYYYSCNQLLDSNAIIELRNNGVYLRSPNYTRDKAEIVVTIRFTI